MKNPNSNAETELQPEGRSAALQPQKCAWDDSLPAALLFSTFLRRGRRAPWRQRAFNMEGRGES